jgi:hypothetical protein
VKSGHLARLTLIGIAAKERGNRIKEFKILNKINQKQKTTKQKNKNLSMKEKQKHRQRSGHGPPVVGTECIKNLVGKESRTAGRFTPSSRLILQ